MTLSSDAPPVDPSALPADPGAYRPRRSRAVWLGVAAALAWTGASVGLGVWIAGRHPHGGAPAAPITLPFITSHAPESAAPPAPLLAAPEPAAPDASADGLTTRVERLEGDQRRAARAAAAALAAATLSEAAQQSGPFDADLASVSRLLPATTDLTALQRLARQGAPTRAALALEFRDIAAQTATAARRGEEGAGFVQRLGRALSGVITIRRISNTKGSGPDAVLARAQRALEDGALERAVAELDKLPPAARETLRPWRERAQRRLEIDAQLSRVRTEALRELSAAGGTGA